LRDAPRSAHRCRRASGTENIDDVGRKVRAVRQLVEDELRECSRAPGSVTIVGVSKKQPAEVVRSAIESGLADIGENYLQEAKAKFSGLPPVRKHFIGHLQTNKAKAVVELFDVVQSVDRIEAGEALAKACAGVGKVLPVLLQVNISPAERFGCPPQEAERLAEALRALPDLRLEGIMAIGPATDASDEISRAFELAAKTFARVGGSTLSIGMSGDWRQAVRAGSTMIRLGTALFGSRNVAL
jgi:PLP dependent protein